MAKYEVTFEKYETYDIEAENEDEAFDKAYDQYKNDISYMYDFVQIDGPFDYEE